MSRSDQRVRPAQQEDAETLGNVLAAAFHDDPVWAWIVPDEASRERRLGELFMALVESGVARGERILTTEARSGAAVWRAPGNWRESGPGLSVLGRIVSALGLRGVFRMLRVGLTIQKHHPDEPHWYLELLGTDPARQGTGVGSALIREVTSDCDQDRLGAYLETQVLANVEFYSRHGFEVRAEVDVPLGGPHLWLMWREPRHRP